MTAPALPAGFATPPQVQPAVTPPIAHPFAPPAPAPLTPLEQEIETRHTINRWLDMVTTVTAPTWEQTLFSGKPIRFNIPTPPAKSLAALDREHQALPGDGPAAAAKTILETLQKARPRGMQPRTNIGRAPLPPPRDVMSSWLRRVFLLTAGPAALRLLASAGQLADADVTIIEAAYPQGLDKERKDSVAAGTTYTAAAMRGRHAADLPMWLNDQLLTLMDEMSPADVWQELYGKNDKGGDAGPKQSGLTGSGSQSAIVKNAAPGTGGTSS